MDKETLSFLLKKFREGTCTPAEEARLHAWLDALEQDGATMPADTQHVREQMIRKIFTPAPRYRWLKVAAVLLPLAIAAFFAVRKHTTENLTAVNWRTVQNISSPLQRITLPDSSVVLLGKYAVIRFPDHFSGAERCVQLLSGKVFFETVTDPIHPFIVEDTTGIRTTVLGTSFTAEMHPTRIAVATGSVKVQRSGGKAIILKPAQRLTFRGPVQEQDSIATADILAWTKGEIVLRNATLRELLLTIENQYNIAATTRLNVDEGNYTIRIPASMPLPEVLEIIQKISYKPKIHFAMHHDRLTIY